MNNLFGRPLVADRAGGHKGGGAVLTPEGARVTSDPLVENGRLFICYRTGVNDPKVAAVARSIAQVMRRIDYVDL
ncbi:hypothetical protein [Azospirillum sp. A26]|uniref:hypothetical protein n=1 Tax=Azospirillum sp. A26 TaxID=3160607 RepID=UPI00366BB0F9